MFPLLLVAGLVALIAYANSKTPPPPPGSPVNVPPPPAEPPPPPPGTGASFLDPAKVPPLQASIAAALAQVLLNCLKFTGCNTQPNPGADAAGVANFAGLVAQTSKACSDFQGAVGLAPTGCFDSPTATAVRAYLPNVPVPVPCNCGG